MNIKIAKADIFPTLVLVINVVEKRQTLPILANILFSLTDGVLSLVATDLEVEISETILNVDGDNGEFTISARKIYDIVRNLPENDIISLNLEDGKIKILSGRSRYTMNILSATDFPRIEVSDWEERFKIKQSSLKALLEKTAFSMGVHDVRYYLNGVLFELTQNRLRAIATNGHRLAQSEADIVLSSEDNRELIVPRKAVAEITRFLDDEDEAEITIEVNKNHLKLTKNEQTIVTKLLDGKFPELKGVLDVEPNITLTANRSEFVDTMVRAATLFASEEIMGVKITLESGTMRVFAKSVQREEAVGELDVDYKGDTMDAGYKVNYLIDAARAVSSENIEFHLQGSDNVCVIKQPGDDRSTWLIMPLRI